MKTKKVSIDVLSQDPRINARGTINRNQVSRMIASLKDGKTLPPIHVTKDYVIVDGNHRYTALKEYGAKYCNVVVVTETDPVKLYELSLVNNTGLQHSLYQKYINIYNLYHHGKSYTEINTLIGEKLTEPTLRSIIKRVHYLHPDLLYRLGDDLKLGVADLLISVEQEDQLRAFVEIKGKSIKDASDILSEYSKTTVKYPKRDPTNVLVVEQPETSSDDVMTELGTLIATYGSDKLKEWFDEFTA